jgi:hypothetical protein
MCSQHGSASAPDRGLASCALPHVQAAWIICAIAVSWQQYSVSAATRDSRDLWHDYSVSQPCFVPTE